MEIIGKNISFLRKRKGWTQAELAERLGTTYPVIGSYEQFRAAPPIKIMVRMADLFLTDLDTLLKVDLEKQERSGIPFRENFFNVISAGSKDLHHQ